MASANTSVAAPIASLATSRDGFEFAPTTRNWRLSRDVTIGLRWMDEFLDEPCKTGALKVLVYYAERYSAAHTINMAGRLRSLLSFAFVNDGRYSVPGSRTGSPSNASRDKALQTTWGGWLPYFWRFSR
jgi:hypothetical protein